MGRSMDPAPDERTAPPERPRQVLATVGALVTGPSGRVLLVRTRKWRGLWGVPGGKIEYGETIREALLREFREETGLELHDLRWGPVQEAVESPEFHRPAHMLLLNFLARSGSERVRLNDEAEAHAWAAPEEALGMALNEPTRRLVRFGLEHGPSAAPLGAAP